MLGLDVDAGQDVVGRMPRSSQRPEMPPPVPTSTTARASITPVRGTAARPHRPRPDRDRPVTSSARARAAARTPRPRPRRTRHRPRWPGLGGGEGHHTAFRSRSVVRRGSRRTPRPYRAGRVAPAGPPEPRLRPREHRVSRSRSLDQTREPAAGRFTSPAGGVLTGFIQAVPTRVPSTRGARPLFRPVQGRARKRHQEESVEPTPQHPEQHPGQAVGPDRHARGPCPTWEEIVDRLHSERVYRLAMRLTGNRHDAEDLTQEVFVRVFRSLSTYTPGTFEGWIHRITTNLFLDQARRKQRIRFDVLSPTKRADRLHSPSFPALTRRTPTRTFDDDIERSPGRPCPRSSGPRSSCATSRARPTKRSRRSSTPSSAPSARGSTGDAPCCVRRSPIGGAGAGSATRIIGAGQGTMSHLGDRLSALVDGELSHDERDRLHAHLAACKDCRAEAAALRALKRRVGALGDTADGRALGCAPLRTCRAW